jgi:hypothetical protein
MLKKIFNRGANEYSEQDARGPQGNVASVLDLVPLQQLFGNVLVLKDGSYRMIMRVGAVNFDLKGEREQMMILHTFGEMLNTLQVDFPIQILLHSTQMDTESYLRSYRERLKEPALTDEMRAVIEDHIEYFQEQARSNYLLDRSYFVVIPYYDRSRAPVSDGNASESMPLGGMLSRFMDSSSAEQKQAIEKRDMEKARIQLQNRCGLVASQLSRLSITANVLDDLAVIRLLHEMYNPASSERSSLNINEGTGAYVASQRTPSRDLDRGRG